MTVKITTAVLDAVGGAHDLRAVLRAREILTAAGLTDIELHPLEIHEISELRRKAEGYAQLANKIEARGPMPERDDDESDIP